MSALRTAVLALGASMALTRGAHADALQTYGFGARSTALAGAVSADVDDFSANYYNPAGLARGHALRLDFGYFYAQHALQSNGADNHVDPAHGIVGGLAAPGTLFGMRFAFGLGIHLPDDRISRSRALPQIQPRWELYDNRVQLLFIAANVAIAPTPWLRIGGGLGFVSSTHGALEIYGDLTVPDSSHSSLHHTVDADLTSVRYPLFGVQVDVLPTLTLAAAYRGEYHIDLDISARVDGTIVLGQRSDPNATRIPGTYTLHSTSTAVFQPQQGVLGASWRVTPSVTVDADVTWVNWAAYVNPTSNLDVALDVNIPPGLGIARPSIPAAQTVVPANFHDTFVPRIGLEWRRPVGVHTVALRTGYRYEASPVPDQTGVTNFYDCNRHVLAIGAGLFARGMAPVLPGGLSLDVHAEVQLLESRSVRKLDPSDPIGDATIGGQVWNLGATLAVAF